jgi:ribonuclease P protein component
MTEGTRAKRLTFPKSRRLTRSTEFEQVKKSGRVYRGQLVLLSIVPAKDPVGFRAGFITSRALGRAVVRNRIRRRLREIVRKHQGELIHGIWMVTIARAPATRASYDQLEVEWLRLAKRASILATSC